MERSLPTVEIYTQPWCPYCSRALNLLTEKGVPYTEIEAPPGSAARAEARTRSGGRTSVPQIFINGAHVGGSDDLQALNRAGKLDAMLAPQT
jgi:glutaredoxin 3